MQYKKVRSLIASLRKLSPLRARKLRRRLRALLGRPVARLMKYFTKIQIRRLRAQFASASMKLTGGKRKSKSKSKSKSKPKKTVKRTASAYKTSLRAKIRATRGARAASGKRFARAFASRAMRPSPPLPANDWCGRRALGNDGRVYVSRADVNGVCRWRLA